MKYVFALSVFYMANCFAVNTYSMCEASAEIAGDIYLYKKKELPVKYIKEYLEDRYPQRDLRTEILTKDPASLDKLIKIIYQDNYPLDYIKTKEVFLKSCLQ